MTTRRLTALVLAGLAALLLMGNASTAFAATQTYNGDIVQMIVTDTTRPDVRVKPSTNLSGPYVQQYYPGPSWGCVAWLNNGGTWSAYGSGYAVSGLTAVSNVTNVIAGGTEIVTVVGLGASGVQLTQKYTHMTGDRFITKEWVITNVGSTTFSGARFYEGGDTLFGGVDSAYGFYDASKSMVYVRNNDYTNWGVMGFYANPGTPADRYYEGQYNIGRDYAAAGTALPNTVNPSFVDAGYYLEWDRASLAPGASWTIKAYEVWTPAGALQILAPGTQNAVANSTVTLPFTVQNLGGTPLNLTLAASSGAGWTTSVVGGTSVTIPANSSVTQNVQVTVPPGATGSSAINLTASGDAAGTGATTLNVVNVDVSIDPASIDFGTITSGDTTQQIVTVTNNSGAPVTFGTVSAVAPFGRASDNISGITLADGATATVMATFSSGTGGSYSGSLSIPLISPVLLTRTVSLSGTVVSNQAPVAIADTATAVEDTTLSVSATGVLGNDTDADSDPLTASLVSGVSHGTLALASNGGFTYKPSTDYNGPDSFTYHAYDGTAYSNTVTVSITVTAVNDAPVAAGDAVTTNEDTALIVVAPGVLGNDSDPVEGSSLTAGLVSGVSHGALALAANGSYAYTPATNFNGTDSFTYRAHDGTDYSNTVTVTITVTAVNDRPVPIGDSATTTEDAVLTVTAPGVLGNDLDVEGDPLTAELFFNVSHGTLALAANGSYTYMPAANWSGTDSFTYRAFDGTDYSNQVTVSINVTAVNDAPVAVADSATTAEDTPLTVTAPGVLANDTDTEGGALTADLVASVSHGTLALAANGSYTYTPAANWNGTDSFSYRAYDGTAYSAPVTVSINVTAVNDAPVAVADSATTAEDTPLTVTAPGVLANDTDTEGGALTADLVASVSHGTLALAANGSYTYTPAANWNGTDSFSYRAYDGTAYSAPVTVSINVTAVNDAPVAVADSAATAEDTPLTVAAPGVLANDTDTEGDALTADLVASVSHGTLALAANGSYTYTPAANWNGTDSFSYRAYDGTAYSAPVTVSINVTAVNDAPVAVAWSGTTSEDTALVVAVPGLLTGATDLDGGVLTATLVAPPSHGSVAVASSGSFVYDPEPGYHGTDSFTFQAFDGAALSAVRTASITISAVNHRPVAAPDSHAVSFETTLLVAAPGVLGNDTDLDRDGLTAALDTAPAHGTLSLAAGGGFTYRPADGFSGSDSFTYHASDASLSSAPTTVSLSVGVAPLSQRRSGGADRYEVSRHVGEAAFPGWAGVHDIVIVSGSDRAAADPITAGAIAGLYDGPLLLVREDRSVLPSDTIAALQAISAANTGTVSVHIVGGPASVPEALKTRIAAHLPSAVFERIGGADRYVVAANVALRVRSVLASRGISIGAVFVANGQNAEAMLTALALSPIAAHNGMPVLLVKSTFVPASTTAALKTLGVTPANRYAAGPAALVSAAVLAQTGVPVANRIAHATDSTRFGTAAAIAETAMAKGWLGGVNVGIANELPDALTGGMLMGKLGGPLLYVDAASLPPSTLAFLRAHRASVRNVEIIGGPASIPDGVVTDVMNSLR